MNEYIVDETPESRLKELAKEGGVHILLYPDIRTDHLHGRSTGVWFINTGSVGRSEDGDPRACYALLSIDPFSVTHVRVTYDIERAAAAIHDHHLPEAFARIIREGKPLDAIGIQDEKERPS